MASKIIVGPREEYRVLSNGEMKDALELIHVPTPRAPSMRPELIPEPILAPQMKFASSDPEIFLHTSFDIQDNSRFRAITISCDPRYATPVPGLVATQIAFTVHEISWCPGAGSPTYHTYAPNDSYDGRDLFRNMKHHQICPLSKEPLWAHPGGSDGTVYSAVCAALSPSTWFFGVNDWANYYDDNLGYFLVDITSWS